MDEFQRRNGQHSFTPRTRTERLGSRVSRMSGKSGKNGKKGKYSRFFNKKWFMLVGLTSLLLMIGGCSAVMMSAQTYDLKDINSLSFSSNVYDEHGQQIGRIGSVYRENLTWQQLMKYNPNLPKAFLKVEDNRFYQHDGVDWYGLGRALVTDLIEMKNAQGGGTITMQVARNVLLKDRTKSYTRKLKEISAALNIERKYTKNQILMTYLNYIDFGNQVAGIEMAAKIYFGKDLKTQSLTPPEMAFLAGLPKAPSTYNPYRGAQGLKDATQRRNIVLMKMAGTDALPPIITVAQEKEYDKMPLGTNVAYLNKYLKANKYEAYLNQVKNEVMDRYGLSENDLMTGGYSIYTGIDPKAQQTVETALKDNELFKNKEHENLIDSGITMLDPHTGLIKAIGGGRNYQPGSLNRARQLVQPGSSIKPVAVFAPAVELKGYNQYTQFQDAPFSVGNWSPHNFSNTYAGTVPFDEVVYDSINVVTVKMLMQDVGLANSYNYAKKVGLPLLPQDEGPASLGLGGLTKGVSTINMAQAYSVFPNYGKVIKAHTISKIMQGTNIVQPKDGDQIDDQGNPTQVFTPKTAWYMIQMMKDVIENPHGTAHSAIRFGRPAAGKTGTIQNEDAGWFVGYTPDLVLAVNVFNDTEHGQTGHAQITGGTLPARVWNYVMEHTLEGTPVHDFQKPAGVPDPVPPFQLQAPQVSGQYDQTNNVVNLSWQKQDPRVVYTVQRSEDGVNFTDLQTNINGNSFSDTSVQPPNQGGLFGGGGGSKTYYYKVIATDTQATDPSVAQQSSGVIQVNVVSSQPAQPQPCDQNGQPPGCQPQNNGPSNGNGGNNNTGNNNAGGGLFGGGTTNNGGTTTNNGGTTTNNGGTTTGNGGKKNG